MKTLQTRDPVLVYVGKSRLHGIIIGLYEQELFPDCYWIQLDNGPFVDAHRYQLRKLKQKRRFFLARFEGTTISPEGFAFPKHSLEAAQKLAARHELAEIVEVVEVRRHRIEDIPPRPAFLDKSTCNEINPELASEKQEKIK